MHMGTLVAVLIYFARVWLDLAGDILRGRFRLVAMLIVATIPAVVAALLCGEVIAGPLRSPWVIAAALVVGSLVFVIAERLATDRRPQAGIADAAAIGLAQSLALIPGMSRSGLTISTGLALGLRRDEATRLSFLLSTPAVLGAGLKTALDARTAPMLFDRPDALAIGFMTALVSGVLAIHFMVRFLRRHSLAWFVPYRLALAAAVAAAAAAGIL